MQKKYVKHYQKLEEKHWWWQVRRNILNSEINNLPSKTKNKKLLDIGCGPGINIKFLKEKFECIGVEPDIDLLKAALKNTKSIIHKGYLPNNLPKFENKFDLILLLDVLEHVTEDKKSLKTIMKHLTNKGYLIVNVPAMSWLWSVHDEINQHKRRYDLNQLTNLLESAGYEIIKIRYWGCLFAPMAWFERNWLKKSSTEEYIVTIPSYLINSLFKIYAKIEYVLTQRINLPFGLSIFAIVRKK